MRLHKCNNSAFPLPVFQMDYKLPDLPDVKIKLDPGPRLTETYWQGVIDGLRDYLNLHIKVLGIVRMIELGYEIDRLEAFKKGNQLTYTITKKSNK